MATTLSDTEVPMCRICHGDDLESELRAPCRCAGSMRFVHPSCLLQWLDYKASKSCEVRVPSNPHQDGFESTPRERWERWEMRKQPEAGAARFDKQVCKHPFAFSPLYRQDTPHSLPLEELLVGLARRVGLAVGAGARLATAVGVWTLVPVLTCWLWRLSFVRTLSQVVPTPTHAIGRLIVVPAWALPVPVSGRLYGLNRVASWRRRWRRCYVRG
jgi:E3 ubiquitin-protein ligase MARCH6